MQNWVLYKSRNIWVAFFMLSTKVLPKDFKVYELGRKKTKNWYALFSGFQSLGSSVTTDKIQHGD